MALICTLFSRDQMAERKTQESLAGHGSILFCTRPWRACSSILRYHSLSPFYIGQCESATECQMHGTLWCKSIFLCGANCVVWCGGICCGIFHCGAHCVVWLVLQEGERVRYGSAFLPFIIPSPNPPPTPIQEKSSSSQSIFSVCQRNVNSPTFHQSMVLHSYLLLFHLPLPSLKSQRNLHLQSSQLVVSIFPLMKQPAQWIWW